MPNPVEFESQAKSESQPSLLREFWQFLCENKKWWLLPTLIVLIALGVIIALAGTGAAPFIYSLQ